jgi:hypothetical protein
MFLAILKMLILNEINEGVAATLPVKVVLNPACIVTELAV